MDLKTWEIVDLKEKKRKKEKKKKDRGGGRRKQRNQERQREAKKRVKDSCVDAGRHCFSSIKAKVSMREVIMN